MKLVLSVVLLTATASYAAKLDKTYLPPSGAHNSGGSPGALQTPVISGPFNGPDLSETSNDHYKGPNLFGGVSHPAVGHSGHFLNNAISTSVGKLPYSESNNSVFSSPANTFSSMIVRAPNSISSAPSFEYNAPTINGPTQTYGVPTSSQFNTERPQAAQERNSNIVHQHNDISSDGYSYAFETENGIRAEESGVTTNGVQAQGGFSYMGDDGNKYSITYTADENGYRPQGKHLPTPPPIPDVILRSLETIARAKASGISYEDGDDNIKHNMPVQQFSTPFQNYDVTSFMKNGRAEQNNIPAHQTQQYGERAQPNTIMVQDYNTPSSKHGVSAELNNRDHINNGPAHKTTTPVQKFSSLPNIQFGSPTQSENIAQNVPSSQHHSGPYNYNAPSQQHNGAIPLNDRVPHHNGLQSQRFNVPDQKYNTPPQYYNGPVRDDKQGVPIQSYNRAPEQNIAPAYQSSSETQRLNFPTQQYTLQAQSIGIREPTKYPAQVQGLTTPIPINNFSTHSNNGPSQFNNVNSHQTKPPAQYFNRQQYSTHDSNKRPVQQYTNHASTPVQHSSAHVYGSSKQPNNEPAKSDGSYQNKSPVYQTSSQAERYTAPAQRYSTSAQSGNPTDQQRGMAYSSIPAQEILSNQFGVSRDPESFSPETGYKY